MDRKKQWINKESATYFQGISEILNGHYKGERRGAVAHVDLRSRKEVLPLLEGSGHF